MSLSKSLKNSPCNIFYTDIVSLHVSIQKISISFHSVCVCAVYSLRNVTPLPYISHLGTLSGEFSPLATGIWGRHIFIASTTILGIDFCVGEFVLYQ